MSTLQANILLYFYNPIINIVKHKDKNNENLNILLKL